MATIIRWGILGAGAAAEQFAEGLRVAPDAELAAVGSLTRARAEAFAERFGARRVHGSGAELARDPEVDVVYIATPTSSHKADCLLCLGEGKPVLCEKPFTQTAAEAREVIDAARRRGLFCMEAMWMRFAPVVREAIELARSGAIGEIRMVSAQLGFSFVVDPESRLFKPELGGGALLDLGVYPLSLASAFLGPPASIKSDVVVGATGVDEQLAVILGYGGGRQAVVSASLRSRASNDALILGTEGTIHLGEPLYFPETMALLKAPPMDSARRGQSSRFAWIKRRPIARRLTALVARARVASVTRRARGNGREVEAEEVMRCLRAGERESAIMPLDETLSVLATMDAIRAQREPAPGVRG